MTKCLYILVEVFSGYFVNFLKHFFNVGVLESRNLLTFFFQPLLLSTFILFLDFLLNHAVFFLI